MSPPGQMWGKSMSSHRGSLFIDLFSQVWSTLFSPAVCLILNYYVKTNPLYLCLLHPCIYRFKKKLLQKHAEKNMVRICIDYDKRAFDTEKTIYFQK